MTTCHKAESQIYWGKEAQGECTINKLWGRQDLHQQYRQSEAEGHMLALVLTQDTQHQ